MIMAWKDWSTRYPLVTVGIGLLTLVLFLCSNSATLLQYDRAAIEAGELWRVVTGHFLHWSFDHFLWCTITFLAIGCICENISRRGYIATLMAAGIIISLVSWFAEPGLAYYRGLSGLASAIFIFGALMLVKNAWASDNRPGMWLPALAGIGFAGKIIFEFASGSTLFVDSTEIFTPMPLIHLAGGAAGLLVAILYRGESSREEGRARMPTVSAYS